MRIGGPTKVFIALLILVLLYLLTLYSFILTSPASPKARLNANELYYGDHGNDHHKDLQATDEIIIVLGYKLYNDGMPTKILYDRVARAVALYQQMMQEGIDFIIILSFYLL